jgi:hypothetical protein
MENSGRAGGWRSVDVLYSAQRFLYIRVLAGGAKDANGWKVGTSAKESPFNPFASSPPLRRSNNVEEKIIREPK